MDKNKIKVIITGILVVVLFFAWANTFKILKGRGRIVPSAQPAVKAYLLSESATSLSPALGESLSETKNPEWKRCPFSGKIYSGTDEQIDLKLSGIVWDEKAPQAIINDKVIEEGSFIGQFRVIKILKDRVRLSQNENIFEIKLAK